MSEERRQSLNGGDSFEARVLAEFAQLNNRMTSFESRMVSFDEHLISLEEKVDARLRETRPIWETVLSRLDLIDAKVGVLGNDLIHMRGEVDLLKKRVPPAA
jgi:hypothetical protein